MRPSVIVIWHASIIGGFGVPVTSSNGAVFTNGHSTEEPGTNLISLIERWRLLELGCYLEPDTEQATTLTWKHPDPRMATNSECMPADSRYNLPNAGGAQVVRFGARRPRTSSRSPHHPQRSL